ncbi:MAG: HAMP domain-containing histidine kinase [Bacteroidales bacterium]|nr:HAMP domain-containing histidine kinase [Bacteroidales bacterium]
MNKNYKHLTFLIIAILLFALSYFIYKIEKRKATDYVDTELIEKRIQELESELKIIISETEKSITEHKEELKESSNSILFDIIDIKAGNNFSILVYQNDSLKYWSNNSVPIPYKYSEASFSNKRLVKLENGWYDIIKEENEDFLIVGLLKIKNGFFYENQHLNRDYTLGINIPSTYVISEKPISIGVDIKSESGEYLFSLILPIENNNSENTKSDLPASIFFLSIVFLLIFLSKQNQHFSEYNYSYLYSSLISAGVVFLFILIIKFQVTYYIFNSNSFNQNIFINNLPLLTIGEIFLFSVVLLFIINNLFRIIPLESLIESLVKKSKYILTAIFTGIILLIFIYFTYINNIVEDMIVKSDIFFNIQNILTINIINITAHLIIGILYASFLLLLDHFIRFSERLSTVRHILISVLFAEIILISTNYFRICPGNLFESLSFFIITITIVLIRFYKQEYSYYSIIILIFLLTVFTVIFENKHTQIKENYKQENLISLLANERDEMAEQFLTEINERLNADTGIVNILRNINENQYQIIFNYLKRKYFYGYWEKYDLELVLCGNSEFYRDENQTANCEGFYTEEFNQSGVKIDNTSFWHMNYNTGKITYTGFVDVPDEIDKRSLILYITLSEKLISKSLGYPKLLIDKSSVIKSEFEDYSYAKYTTGVLAVKYGKYQYDLIENDFSESDEKKYFKELNGYKHLILTNKSGQKFILSRIIPQVYDLIISFAYLFVLYNFLIFIAILIFNHKFVLKRLNFDFKNQIRFSMILILLISFFLFGAGTIYYAVKENKRVNNKEMTDKVQSVLIELTHKLYEEDKLTPEWHTDKYDHLDELLIKFSQVFFSDINLYDLNGNLLATSRSEIFNRGLTGKQMNSKAFKMMVINKKTEFIQKENIGELEFSSIYIPFKNVRNKITAYINLPYFSKNDTLQKNLSNVLIATVNLYVVLFLITIFLAFFISTEITRPIRMLQSKFKALQLGKKHQEIIYNKKDEIGNLVNEYNLMVSKLEISAKKLAESERESAWREMAKQIAHEIKNPLTPMKLSIQLLQKTWYDNPENHKDFENRLNNVSETLIEQINTLSTIASEFSSFAKMPKTRKEEVDIAKKLKTVTGLFENTKNIDITLKLNNNENIQIIADKEQVSRVFINLIKNAVQSIPKDKKGKINIELTTYSSKAKIKIEDNGNGIPDDKKERLFEPSFTTKTTGMGIGLAIVKNIVNSAGGDIWFESEENIGTIFYVEFLKV